MKKKTLLISGLCVLLVLALIVPLVLLLSGGDKYNSIERHKEGVKLLVHFREGHGLVNHGSAFVINNAGNLITNAHVVGNDDDGNDVLEEPTALDVFYVVYEKQLKTKKVVVMQRAYVENWDPSRDLALLRVNSPDRAYFKPLALARTATSGQPVKALGFPGTYDATNKNMEKLFMNFVVNYIKGNHQYLQDRCELEWNIGMKDLLDVTSVGGAVSKITESHSMATGLGKDARVRNVTHNASIKGGMSGGPLINDNGWVVGVNYSTRAGDDSINNALDVSELLHFITPAGGDPSQMAIIEGNPDSPVYILRAHLNNMSSGEVVVVVIGGLFVVGCVCVLVLMLVQKRKPHFGGTHMHSTGMGGSDSPLPGSSEPTIPMGDIKKGPELLFTGANEKGEPIRYRIPLDELRKERFFLIGRNHQTCKLHVASSESISRQQARVMYEEDASGNVYLYIRDEMARNTTCLNGVPLHDKCLLMPGDEISFAGVTIKFTIEGL